jgi:hypothetical protein
MNKFQIIETHDYILAVSGNPDRLYNTSIQELINRKMVVGYTQKNNAPELDLPLLPEIVVENDVEKLAEKYADFSNDYITMSFGDKFNETSKRDFIAGYKAATKIYSEDDLIEFALWIRHNPYYKDKVVMSIQGCKELFYTHYIQSLKQPAHKWFVAEQEDGFINELGDFSISMNSLQGNVKRIKRLKTTTTNGKTYLVGTYLNE